MDVATPERPRAPESQHARPGVARATWELFVAMLRTVARGFRGLRRWNRRDGAGHSGLAGLVELHAVQAAGDAFVTVALAGHLFFEVPSGQARSRVALYLLITMAPFAVLSPLLGPLLDRFAHGRRVAIAVTAVSRAALALVIARNLGSSVQQALALYPAALGVLVAGKAYSVVRSAIVPRLLPRELSLVQANARLTFAGVVAPGVAAAVAIGLTKAFGHVWTLRAAAVVYVLATFLALRLPRRCDGGPATRAVETSAGRGFLRLSHVHPEVRAALRSTAALRALAGFLTLYGAFVVREHSVGGLSPTVALAALAVGLGVGNLIGTTTGVRLAALSPPQLAAPLIITCLVATLVTAIQFGLVTVFAVAVVSSAAVAIAKLALDASIQRRVDDAVRTSTFARSETALQLAWVAGGAVGIIPFLPTYPAAGFGVATAALAVAAADAVRTRARRQRSVEAPSAPV